MDKFNLGNTGSGQIEYIYLSHIPPPMTLAQKIGYTLAFLLVFLTSLITIRLSGHTISLGILFLGLLVVDVAVIIILCVLNAFRLIGIKLFLVFVAYVITTFTAFTIYHRSYDSYHETRELFWGLNGEKNMIHKVDPLE